jgi:hypothetical protein
MSENECHDLCSRGYGWRGNEPCCFCSKEAEAVRRRMWLDFSAAQKPESSPPDWLKMAAVVFVVCAVISGALCAIAILVSK